MPSSMGTGGNEVVERLGTGEPGCPICSTSDPKVAKARAIPLSVGILLALLLAACSTTSTSRSPSTTKSRAPTPARTAKAVPSRVTPHGLWVSDINAATVTDFESPPGSSPAIVVSRQMSHPDALAFDAAGNLWVGDGSSSSHPPAIEEYSPNELLHNSAPGEVVTKLGQAISPEGLAFDATGDLWVAGGTAVVEYSAASLHDNPSPARTMAASSLIDGPDSLAFDQAGDLWVASYNNRMLVEYSTRSLSSSHPRASRQIQLSPGVAPYAIAFDPRGDLWVASRNDTVVEYAASTLGTTNVPSATLNMSSFISGGVTGIAFDSQGNLWASAVGSSNAGQPEGIVYEYAASTLGTTNTPASHLVASSSSNPGTWALAFFPPSSNPSHG